MFCEKDCQKSRMRSTNYFKATTTDMIVKLSDLKNYSNFQKERIEENG